VAGPGGISSSSGGDPLLGTAIAGRYRIVERLASGGMGTVYKAEQLGLDRLVALKILDPRQLEGTTQDSRAEDDIAVLEKRFSREAAMLARLAHPNIVTVFDYGSIEGADGNGHRFYMAMELLGGETLQSRLATKKRLLPDEAINLGAQIARALREAHAHGIVHRDLKPANVMIVTGRDGEELVKLLDFGIGKIVDSSVPTDDPRAELTQEGRFVGSPLYMSPEQIAHGKVDARTDVYSLGVLLYRCIAGIHPFHRENTAMVMLAHLNAEPTPLREKVRDIPVWLDEVIQRCLIKDPNQRLASMEELLRAFGEHMSMSLPGSTPASLPISSPSGRHSPAQIRAVPQDAPTLDAPTLHEAFTPHSHHATTLSASPLPLPAAPPPKPRSALIFALPALVLVALIAAVVVRVTRTEAVAPVASGSTSIAAPIASTFTVTITSKPPHAHVMENGVILGDTPLVVKVDRASVSEKARTFTLELDGYQPAKVFQGLSESDVTQDRELLPLVADAAPTTTAAPSATATVPGKKYVPPPKPTASSSAVSKPPDINLVR
jgi:serine/threonine-protein kinase